MTDERPTQPSIDVIPAGSSADKRLHIQWKDRAERAENELADARAALSRLGLAWEDADVHPRCGADEGCKSCNEAWEAYSLVLEVKR